MAAGHSQILQQEGDEENNTRDAHGRDQHTAHWSCSLAGLERTPEEQKPQKQVCMETGKGRPAAGSTWRGQHGVREPISHA